MDNNATCKKGGIKCLIPVAAVFITMFLFEWVYHGIYMMPAYETTASLWRGAEEMKGVMWAGYVSKLIMAFAICCLFCWVAKGCESQGKCVKKGAKFGFKIGLIIGAHSLASYIWLPISLDMAVKWVIGDVLMGILIGIVLAYITRIGGKGECKAA